MEARQHRYPSGHWVSVNYREDYSICMEFVSSTAAAYKSVLKYIYCTLKLRGQKGNSVEHCAGSSRPRWCFEDHVCAKRCFCITVINKASQLVTSGANVKGSLWKVNGYNPVQLVLKWETLTGKK